MARGVILSEGFGAVSDRVLDKICFEPNTGCWLWMGWKLNGYGKWTHGGVVPNAGKHVSVHRYIYEQLVGPIPEGLEPDHLCRVRHCANPAHLEPVTHRVNCQRGGGVRFVAYRMQICMNGHPRTEENTHICPNGERRCRICRAAREREGRARRRSQQEQ